MRRPRLPSPRRADLLTAAGLLAATELEVLAGDGTVAVAVLAPLAVAPLVWRRNAPLLVLVLVLAAVSIIGAADPAGEWVTPFAAVLLSLYSVAAYTERRQAIIGLALVLLFFASGTVLDNLKDPGRRPLGDLIYMTVLNTSGWVIGRIVRRWREQALALEQRTAELEQERAWRERAAVAQERNRIARELHDVIAHSVSLMVVQAAAAEQMLQTDPPRAREPVSQIQESGRQAVLELRRLLGILRPEEEEAAALAPHPTLRELGPMVARARDAGLKVDLEIEGAQRDLAPGVELTAYRLVQEALTNALKHAGPTQARVVVRYRADRLDIEVTNEQDAAHVASPNGTGHGLAGMRERLALYGGALEAGPRDGGFAVRAHIPLTETTP